MYGLQIKLKLKNSWYVGVGVDYGRKNRIVEHRCSSGNQKTKIET